VKLVALAAALLFTVPSQAIPDYDRDAFGNGWADVDGDCQNTRQEILIRDLEGEQLTTNGCNVASGTLNDPYTGTVIPFQRGETTSDDVQIDHIIPLSYAWSAGAWQWSGQRREEFANDPAELRATDGPTNNAKGARGPSRWLPPAQSIHCTYAATWQRIADTYGLTLDPADTTAIQQILASC
jgi:hypothetical protein